MPIEHHKGSTTVTGDSMQYLQLVSQRGAVGLEMKGLRVSRGPVLWKRLAAHYNIPASRKGRKPTAADVYHWLDAKVQELRPQQEHIVDGKRFVDGQEVQ